MGGVLEVIGGALRFDADTYLNAATIGPLSRIGIAIALLAGLSQAVGQAFILFVNRVRPLRFLISLLTEALLFLGGFLVWATSTWLVAWLIFGAKVPVLVMIRALGIAHAPQLLAFLGALPYLGVPILTLLSLWTAIGFVVGVVAITNLSIWSGFASLVVGWWLTNALQRTAGQPVMALGRALLDRAAGVPLIKDGRRLERMLRNGQIGPDLATLEPLDRSDRP
jgi:hypothetical protein